ncbi:hypothetical protein KIPB_000397 [Kipferlia bialata]|uniref:Metallo-beta-lactamase domain-containing protein n=1 Tax=Kipferlia bialata TaxID=797122 RepID=A0A9K3CQF6_9EUKA|nr:hypothetical protein KIPB_000397 [Kipferlia bialata]|eukprot:g397.t1
MSSATRIVKDFRKLCTLPFCAIIYTHSHQDHVGGAAAFTGSDPTIPIYARQGYGAEGTAFSRAGLTVQRFRGAAQMGVLLPPAGAQNSVSSAINQVRVNATSTRPYAGTDGGRVRPTVLISDPLSVTLGGVDVEIHPGTSETSDALYVYLPQSKVLCMGDAFYQSWPNTAPIRGAGHRDVLCWVQTLSSMLSLPFECAIGGHLEPLMGDAREVITNYRDALSHVHTSTIKCINKGMTPDQCVEAVTMPDHLLQCDYLTEYYGNVQWTVRGIFRGLLGWFSGDPTDLFRLPAKGEAERMAKLAGGVERLIAAARDAHMERDWQWCAQLCRHLLALEGGVDVSDTRLMRADCLDGLADAVLSINASNYYRTVAAMVRRE